MGEKVIVMGGGVIGLSCAYELQKRGHQAVVLEINRCGGQASGAAAGMLAPYSENVEGPDAFFHLCNESLRLYPEWVKEIKRVSGREFEYTESGSLYIAYHEADRLALEGRLLWQREHGSTGALLEGEELFAREPLLSREVKAALYTPEESHLYAPDYVMALEQACRLTGVQIEEQLVQLTVEEWRNDVVVKAQDGRSFNGDRLLVCSGAWAQELADVFGIRIPIYPIRGQICAYEAEVKPVQHMVFSNQGYLVAKENRTLVCGASEDVAGFDTTVTDKGIERLRKWNKQAFPFLAEQTPFHRWAGLRPSTQDGFPLLGRLSASDRVVMAAGHYRNGILLSPVTAKVAADYIERKKLPEAMEAFDPERFSI
ncbi:glycine oxidase ThiO [Paenibacillus sp. NEAU-GSW1]|uniref:glycine oxidase ThiO n=1 Tax=Paenibacillus sp. NEAU-GSW1 TaxID=2682486 RepID=UPI0012E1CC8D|nr:glycine oxidase ThiO [Paenibacillus sp. NEAU-GSW1]MUT65739.1 glycine oxidase ThiO [Paenibacillus sp. NEAU-GSW1]